MYVLTDVDGVLVDYGGEPREGTLKIIRLFMELGVEVVVWSGNGAEYAKEVVDRLALPVTRVLGKPDYPIRIDVALGLLSTTPVLQFDDDPTERVGNWPFMHIPCEGKMPGRKRKVA